MRKENRLQISKRLSVFLSFFAFLLCRKTATDHRLSKYFAGFRRDLLMLGCRIGNPFSSRCMKMEGSVRSGGVLKKKSSSGCLIIKNKGGIKNSGEGLGGFCDNSKEKKRAVASSSSSSDEDESLEFMRRKVHEKRLKNGSMGYKGVELENRECDRDNVGAEISVERKRSRLDLFEFDEYDEFDGKKLRNEYLEDRSKGRIGSGHMKEFGVGSSNRNLVVHKRKGTSYFDGSSSGRSKGLEHHGVRNKGFELDEDEAHMPISLLRLKYQETANEPIRLQGKNGVLKVMVNKKKKMDFPSQLKNYDQRVSKERKASRTDNGVKKEMLAQSPIYPASKSPEKRSLLVNKEKSVEKEKREIKLEKVKPILNKGSKGRDSQIDGTDRVFKLATPGSHACGSRRGIKKEEEKSPPPENITSVKGKEGKEAKAKRGGSTEKQMLREQIRAMLVDAGWTIDYRPRRNRDYLDAVYINPSGTAYWSIIKAYDAFKKQLEEDNGKTNTDVGSPSFAPLSEDLINKLTRQTKKKIEEDMRRKRKEDGMAKTAKGLTVRKVADTSDSDQNDERLSSYMKQNHKSRRGKMSKVDHDSDDDSSEESPKKKPVKVRVSKPFTVSKSSVVQGRTSKVIGRCTLLVRGSEKGENSDSDGYVPYSGKRTMLAWLIDSGTVQLSEKVQYMNRRRTRVMLEGWITRDGIHCGCCSKILTISKFELHAGSKLRQPFQNIFLESGPSLLQCQIDAWNNQEELLRQDFHTVDVDGDDPDDDTCGICGDGGDLMCCDSCPSTFHQVCLDIQVLPSGDWHCPNCTCKFCGYARVNAAEENDNADGELNRCSFYHTSCSDGVHALPMSSDGASFCGLKCRELHDHFQKILGVKHELEAGLSWSLIQRTDVSDASQRSFPQRVECNSKLAVALSVMDECFLPIIDRRSGINIIHNVAYNCGSNFNRLNYRGFYTAILERSDEIISAASIRLHGTRLAEMPFIGTRDMYRRQGMCRRLLSAIETELCSLKVEQLIIPAISEHMNTWTTVFGFDELEDLHKKEIKSMNMLVFPGTDMLQKQLVKPENSDGDKISDSTKNQPQSPISVKNSHSDSSSEQNGQASNDSGCCDEFKTNDEVGVLSSGSPAPATPSNDNTTASPSDATGEADAFLASQGAVVKPEVENERKESSANLKCFPTPAESNNGTDMEHQLLDPPAKDKADSAEATIGNTCKTGTPCQESASVQVNADCSVNVSEDSNPGNTPSNGSVESQPGFVCETSVKSSTDKVNGEPDATSCQTTVSNEHFNLGPSAPVMNSKLHSSMEPSPDSAATHDARVDGADDNNRCDGRASCYDPKVSTAQLTPGPSSEFSAKDSSQSANDSSQTTNENQNPALISASHDVQESNMTCNTSSDHNTETDKPDGEIEPSCGVVQKVASPNASRDALAENTATIENHQNQVTADRNGNAAA
ncbi:UNVERIFIED_CONTAM: Increased DNA methylation 1 [Sesamum calycinum]|uniref:Increased DNA methylation 1 n=1 Tax=Sesamum calycinum TaxID=2727403 RepID=A0AAW2QL04_9LAMI